jgi:hypothetical protein
MGQIPQSLHHFQSSLPPPLRPSFCRRLIGGLPVCCHLFGDLLHHCLLLSSLLLPRRLLSGLPLHRRLFSGLLPHRLLGNLLFPCRLFGGLLPRSCLLSGPLASFATATSTSSFVATALVTAATSPIAELPLDPQASLPMPLLTRQASAWEQLEGPHQPLKCPGHAPSPASVVEHHRRMILHRRCGRLIPPSPFPCWRLDWGQCVTPSF